ncbi:MAG: ABC transporter substrate-binding protein [Actinomycetota bacterium]|nr:ABC transporter substrate-binding protein [Actinomycetota bacterium]
MRKRSLLLLTGLLVLVGSLVIGPAATATTDGAQAGTVVIVHDQEPGILNGYLSEGNGYTVALVMNTILAGGTIYDDKVKLRPYLAEAVPKLLQKEPLKATMTYKKTANWSDGKPVTGADFMATYRTIMNPNWDIVSREGWEDIAKIQVQGKKVTVTFKPKRAYAAWDVLMGNTSPVPAHKVAGQDFNKLWADSIDISSGPFKFQSWQKGTQLSIVKNGAFKAAPAAKLDRIVFRYIAGASQFQALKSGEGDVVEPQPQIQIVDFYKDSKFKVQVGPGYQWEHLDFNQGAKAHPALKKKFVRQAIVQGINRAQIREVLYVKTGLVTNLKLIPVLQSNIHKPFEPTYATPYKRWGFSQKNVIALLKKNGCTGGPDTPSSGNSKIFSCPGVGELTFQFTTTSGNPLRALTFEILQRQLKSVGINFTPRFISPAVLFGGGTLTSGDWQAVMFTFLGGPTSSATYFGIGGCGGDQNYGSSCNRKASALLKKAQFTADAADRTKLLHAAEVILADEVFSIPLFSRPAYLLNSNRVKGPIKNPTQQGSTWNAETWSVSS